MTVCAASPIYKSVFVFIYKNLFSIMGQAKALQRSRIEKKAMIAQLTHVSEQAGEKAGIESVVNMLDSCIVASLFSSLLFILHTTINLCLTDIIDA